MKLMEMVFKKMENQSNSEWYAVPNRLVIECLSAGMCGHCLTYISYILKHVTLNDLTVL